MPSQYEGEQTIKADPAELNRDQALHVTVPVRSAWDTVRGFILWSYERGTVQYDIMVTLILIFVFFSPRVVNFKDRPIERTPPASGVIVYPDGSGGLIYQVDAKAVPTGNGGDVRTQLLRVIEPVSGEVSISKYETVTDKKGKVLSYKVWASRE